VIEDDERNEFRDDDAGYRAWTTDRRIHGSQPAVWNSVGRERRPGGYERIDL
jgi:hypothetical protein